MSIRSLFEADTTAKKPAVELHSYHKFAAAGYLLGSFTFLGMAMINRHNFAVLTVLLAAAAVIELIMFVKFFAMIKGHTIDKGTYYTAGGRACPSDNVQGRQTYGRSSHNCRRHY